MRRRVPGMALVPGATFDLEEDENGVAYDALLAVDRQRIRERVIRDEPYLVVGCPKCTDYSALTVNLQHPKMTEKELRRRLIEREVLLRFAVEVYSIQLAAGRHFLHEHPRGARSWGALCGTSGRVQWWPTNAGMACAFPGPTGSRLFPASQHAS